MKPEEAVNVTPELIAEAAAWLAMLHGPGRTTAVERGFSRWLQTSVAHARAFEKATDVWEESANIPRPTRLRSDAPVGSRIVRPLVALAAGMALAIAGVVVYFHLAGVATNVGEQRALTLEDGTRVMLNTATRVVVSYNKRARRVEVKSGEAMFEVAKRPDWPFIVTAGDRQVRALGTTFIVRREADRLAVTLVEGKVQVTPVAAADEDRSNDSAAAASQALTLKAGQRVIFASGQPPSVDEPELQKTLAWQRREVALDNIPLADAVAEMNRYSVVPLVIEQPEAGQVPVTGLFRAGDSMSFARAVAEAYGLEVHEQSDRIVLSGVAR